LERSETTQYIGKSKIGKLSAKKDKIYAQIRLPPQLIDAIREVADIFEIEHNGKRAFLLVINQSVLDDNMVLQPKTKVVKPYRKNNLEYSFSTLESAIEDVKSLIFQNNSLKENKSPKDVKTKGRGQDSNPRRGLHITGSF
jgi:hypothetical protein